MMAGTQPRDRRKSGILLEEGEILNKGGTAYRIKCTGFADGVLVDVAIVYFYKQFAYWREKRLCGNTSHPKLATVRSR